MFGGLTTTNETLNDMWRFKIGEDKWQQIEQLGDVPSRRCGFSFNLHLDTIFLFGGLLEVTKESDQCYKFNLETHTWEEIGQSQSTMRTPIKTYPSNLAVRKNSGEDNAFFGTEVKSSQ